MSNFMRRVSLRKSYTIWLSVFFLVRFYYPMSFVKFMKRSKCLDSAELIFCCNAGFEFDPSVGSATMTSAIYIIIRIVHCFNFILN